MTARTVLGAFALALVAVGLVVGLMPVSTAGYDCGAPLAADHHAWKAHDEVDQITSGPADKNERCGERVSGLRTASIAAFVAAGVLVGGQAVLNRRHVPADAPD